MTPQRIQRKRAKGWKAPANHRYCGRGTRYGNDYQIKTIKGLQNIYYVEREDTSYQSLPFYNITKAHEHAVSMYRIQMHGWLSDDTAYYDDLLHYDFISCFCPLDLPCHCDAIIEHLQERIKVLA